MVKNFKWELLYRQVRSDLARVCTVTEPETDNTAACFRIAFGYWKEVRRIFKERIIYDDREEIEFFREIKPAFTSWMEYYMLINQAYLFAPANEQELTTFWVEEEDRSNRFFARNRAFVEYYDSGEHFNDHVYFFSRNRSPDFSVRDQVYMDEDCRSSHDSLVRSLLAYRMYDEWLAERKRLG